MRKSMAIAAMALASTCFAGVIDPEWSIARVWDEEILKAIRMSTPRPPVHARNLYHTSAALYDGWATYDEVAHGRFFFEKHVAKDVDAARRETMSYAAYRILKNRFVTGNGPNIVAINANIDATFLELGYDKDYVSTAGDTPAEIGNRIAATIIAAGMTDGSNQSGNYASAGYIPDNAPMPFQVSGTVMATPNHWQPLAFQFLILQNGEIIGSAIQTVLCVHWGPVASFGLNSFDQSPSGLYFHDIDPNGPAVHGDAAMKVDAVDLITKSSLLDPTDDVIINTSPAVWGNAPLGSYAMAGYGLNPVTGQPYDDNFVKRADYARTVAEFWADGPTSETPPGHWHSIANEMTDKKVEIKEALRVCGIGPIVDRLEWDAKMYLTIAGAAHDAAIVAWGRKGYYDSARPISIIRHMAQLGQSSDPKLPHYHPDGLPLIPGLIELITEDDVKPGARFADFTELVYEPLSGEPIGVNDHVGDIAIKSWLGGLYGGVTGVANFGALPGHVYKDGSGWHVGGHALGTNDTPGVLNAGLTTRNLVLSEMRLDQTGDDVEQYAEITGPPGTSLDGVTYIVIGSEVQSKVPDSQGRVQVVVPLDGYTIPGNGVLVIAEPSYSLTTPDVIMNQPFRKISNQTHALVTGFSGYQGQDLDLLDDMALDFTPWTAILDSVGLRRTADNLGLYTATIVGPDNAKNQLYGVGWDRADSWMPYQSSAFVTPPFPGYTSGHTTFSRSTAEALTRFTGSEYFPDGYFSFTMPAGWSNFEQAPSAPVTLSWVRYYDGADEAAISRIYGGIHPIADDLVARQMGSRTGHRSAIRAVALFRGEWQSPDVNLDDTVDGADITAVLGNWGKPGATDLDGDGTTDGADITIILGWWGTSGI